MAVSAEGRVMPTAEACERWHSLEAHRDAAAGVICVIVDITGAVHTYTQLSSAMVPLWWSTAALPTLSITLQDKSGAKAK